MMTAEIQIELNTFAQQVDGVLVGASWFGSLDPSIHTQVLRELTTMTIQSHPTYDEVDKALAKSGVNPTSTPYVLAKKKPFHLNVSKIANLPATENRNSFRVLLSIFREADSRRKTLECGTSCNHWWHKDLLDHSVRVELLDELKRRAK